MKQETQKQHVSMKVNQANLVKGLKYSFTNKTTVLGELMQNARRAGATQVAFEFDSEKKQLVVRDDGCGIDSIETLLTVAESGWNAKTVAEEHPFGIGFLSA
jgi:HSP90 family molecular chaperone